MATPHLVGVQEIADLAGVRPNTVIQWTRRHSDFPPPVADLAGGRVWEVEDVIEWLRLRESGQVEPPAQLLGAEELIGYLMEHGLQLIYDAIQNPGIAFTHTLPVQEWEGHQVPGAVMFVRRSGRKPSDPKREALNAERADLTRVVNDRDIHARSYHQRAAKEQLEAAQQRINAIDHELKAMPVPEVPPPVEAVLVVNDTTREPWERMAADEPYPVHVLLRSDLPELTPPPTIEDAL